MPGIRPTSPYMRGGIWRISDDEQAHSPDRSCLAGCCCSRPRSFGSSFFPTLGPLAQLLSPSALPIGVVIWYTDFLEIPYLAQGTAPRWTPPDNSCHDGRTKTMHQSIRSGVFDFRDRTGGCLVTQDRSLNVLVFNRMSRAQCNGARARARNRNRIETIMTEHIFDDDRLDV